MSSLEIILIATCGVLYLVSLMFLFREMIIRGVVFTPFLVVNALVFILVSPSVFLGPFLGFSDSIYPTVIFTTAFAFMAIGYLATPRIILFPVPVADSFGGFPAASGKARYLGAIVLAIFLIAAGLLYYGGVPLTVYSLISLVSGDAGELSTELRERRLALTKGAYFGGQYRFQGVNNALQEIGWSLLIAYTAAALAIRPSVIAVVRLVLVLVLAWVFVAGTGTRGPFLMAAVTAIIAYSLVRPIRIATLVVLFFGLIGLAIFLGSYSNKMSDLFTPGNIDIIAAVQEILTRLVLGNGQHDVLAIELSRSGELQSSFAQFHIRDFVSALPGAGGGMPLAYHLTEILGGGKTTFRTGTYLSKVYVDFGWVGVVVLYSFIGFTLKVIESNIFPVRLSAWGVAISSVIIINTSELVKGGYHSLISVTVVTVFLFLMHNLISRSMSIRYA